MQALPEPPYVTFQSAFSSPAMRIQVAPYEGYGALYLSIGAEPSDVAWRTEYNTAAGRITLETASGTKLAALSPVFNPTWHGAYDWVRYGLQGAPAKQAQAAAQNGASGIKTIAAVTALSPGAYDVEPAGAQTCPDGTPGDHLRMHARLDPAAHPLTDVVIESSSDRICSMRFHLAGAGLVYSMTGWMQLDFRQIGKYWLIGGGNGEIAMQFFGEEYKHAPLAFAYSSVAFEPPKVPVRPPVFTSALFRKPAARAVATAVPPALKTIEHVHAYPICTTLRENVLRAVEGLRTDDAIVGQLTSAVQDMGKAYAANTHFSRSGNDRASVGQFAGKEQADPALAASQMNLSRYIAQLRHNLDVIYATLNDPKRFPEPAVSEGDKQADGLKAQLLEIAKQQEALLNAASGMNDTLSMQQMIAQGDGTLGATNEPDGNVKRNTPIITGTQDKPVAFGDPLDEMDPSQRNGDPAMSAGRIGSASQPQASTTAQTSQMPSDLANNPLTRLYAGALQNEQAAQQAAAALAKAVGAAANKC